MLINLIPSLVLAPSIEAADTSNIIHTLPGLYDEAANADRLTALSIADRIAEMAYLACATEALIPDDHLLTSALVDELQARNIRPIFAPTPESCPFCSEQDLVATLTTGFDDIDPGVAIACDNCGTVGPIHYHPNPGGDEIEAAIRVWNRRNQK